jgi:flagellar hook-length control protein FliK
MSATVNNNLQNLLARSERAKEASRSNENSNKKVVNRSENNHSSKTTDQRNIPSKNISSKKIEQNDISKQASNISEKEIEQNENELALFDEVLNDQIENGDLYALAASEQALGFDTLATKELAQPTLKISADLQTQTQIINGKENLSLEDALVSNNLSANEIAGVENQALNKQLLSMLAAGTYAVKEDQAPVVAAKNPLITSQANLGEGENVINMMNAKKTIRPQVNPYAKEMPKNMFTNLNQKEVKMIKGKADSLLTSPEADGMKKVDLMTDMNKAVNAINKFESDSSLKLNNKSDVKVLDLSKIQASDSKELINNISDYIAQNATASKSKVEMAVHHDDLGRINITAMKSAPGQVNVEIQTMSNEAHKFFTSNQGELIAHLGTQGIAVSDFKLENSSNANSSNQDSNSGKQFSSNQQGQNQAEDNNRRDESKRRDELWNLLRKDVA